MSEQDRESITDEKRVSKVAIALIAIVLLAAIAGMIFAALALARNPAQTETIRDIVIIFMAGESLLIGFVLIVLIVQVARLTELLRSEIKPILDSTNETLGTLRGTTRFLSDHLVEPVVKVNSSFMALRRAATLFGGRRAKPHDSTSKE